MAIEVVHQVADEWLAELAEDAALGVVDRQTARVVYRYTQGPGDPLASVTVEGGYSVGRVAVLLSERVGSLLPGPAGDDPDSVLERAFEEVQRLRAEVAGLGLTVRGGRIVTVGQ